MECLRIGPTQGIVVGLVALLGCVSTYRPKPIEGPPTICATLIAAIAATVDTSRAMIVKHAEADAQATQPLPSWFDDQVENLALSLQVPVSTVRWFVDPRIERVSLEPLPACRLPSNARWVESWEGNEEGVLRISAARPILVDDAGTVLARLIWREFIRSSGMTTGDIGADRFVVLRHRDGVWEAVRSGGTWVQTRI